MVWDLCGALAFGAGGAVVRCGGGRNADVPSCKVSAPEGLRAGSGGSSGGSLARTLLNTGRELVLFEALSLLRMCSLFAPASGSREGSGGGDIVIVVSFDGLGGMTFTGDEPVSTSSITEAIDPGKSAKLSAELSFFIGRGGTSGTEVSLKGFVSASSATVGESCSLDREYLRKWRPVSRRPGASVFPPLFFVFCFSE